MARRGHLSFPRFEVADAQVHPFQAGIFDVVLSGRLATLCNRFGGGRQPDPAPSWYEAVMWIAMNAAEREEFLTGVHVAVLSAAIGTAGQTLAVPVWYSYQPGGLLTVLTGRRSRKAAAIRAAGRFGLCAQDVSPPYRYVSVEGPVVSEEELDPAERLAMARRYLGAAGGSRYVAGNPDPGRENVAFRMRPERWLSQDQGKGQARADHPE